MNYVFSNFVSKNVTFTKYLPKKSENKFPAHCGNNGNSLSPIFDKHFVKVMVLLNKLVKF